MCDSLSTGLEEGDPYSKYNKRYNVSLILKFLWSSSDHRQALLSLMYTGFPRLGLGLSLPLFVLFVVDPFCLLDAWTRVFP
eukprot:m.581810 g.581810  ORF g.581810 m.581810 type:complete len:81 (+) comp57940_c1_seq1:66-308(+)